MTTATLTPTPTPTPTTEPTRHALAIPDCDCGTCAPTWARRRGKSKRVSQPVTLLEALAAEGRACHFAMIDQHRQCLALMTAAIDRLFDPATSDDLGGLGDPQIGLSLLLFAAELAAALQPGHDRDDLAAEQVNACQQTITEATIAAAGCVTGLLGAVQALAELIG